VKPPDSFPILIVDDEIDLRTLLVEALSALGYRADGAEDGPSALAKVEAQHYPVILTDLNMPGGLSGLELIRALHEKAPKTFTILMTGYATTESAIQALKCGAYDFIQKPFRLAEVEASVARALNHYATLRENESYQQSLEQMVEHRTQEILGLKEDIERLFEGFVEASVTAIEARDPTTSGHSNRVAELTVGLAEAVNATPNGAYGELTFSPRQVREIRYASLLHDFGKVGVKEQVLTKAKKIEGDRLEALLQRFHQRAIEGAFQRLSDAWAKGATHEADLIERLIRQQREEGEQLVNLVRRCNEPSVLPQEAVEELDRLGDLMFQHWSGEARQLMDPSDLEMLRIRKGSLSAAEREEVQSHVTHTYRFLSKIPWTAELAGVPEIAYSHHERLNGRGYPRQLASDAIPVQAKLMAIADVFDALAAHDRPYKAAVGVARSLEILEQEAAVNLLDADLLHIFIHAKVFERTAGPVL
jgi:response regulator RpfG family c-di-GMP phosphodiesterase